MMNPSRALLTVVALVSAAHAAAEPLGRLFFTPEQRTLLDRQRREGHAETALSKTLRVDGRVIRGGEVRTVWLNGRPHHEAAPDAAAGLRVGETFDLATRETRDLVERNAVHAQRIETP